MELACTKKVLDYLGIKAEKVSADIDPLFGWTANLIMINRRKTLVAVHTASRAMFVLHGLTAKQLPKLPELVIDGIRAMLKSEYVRPEIIEQYLDDCGRELIIRANASRSAVANCNKACDWVKNYPEMYVPGDLFQKRILPWLNSDILIRQGYCYTYQTLLHMLRQQYGEDILSCRMAELEVDLQLHTPCKRVIRVPADLNFYQLHRVLQEAFAWKDCHLHQFVTKRDVYERPVEIICLNEEIEEWDDLYELARQDSTTITIEEVFRKYPQIDYEYDFGDGWQHTIRLRRFIEDCPQAWPHCVQAIGDAPMEDCGGPNGFAELMNILKDPTHPEYKEASEWVRGTWWKSLDVAQINRMLRNEHRRPIPPDFY